VCAVWGDPGVRSGCCGVELVNDGVTYVPARLHCVVLLCTFGTITCVYCRSILSFCYACHIDFE
jgi:hypothetical protein